MHYVCKDCHYPVGHTPECPYCECKERVQACKTCNSLLGEPVPGIGIGVCITCAYERSAAYGTTNA